MKPSVLIPKWLTGSLAIISLIGFVDATYLTLEHYRGETPNCSLLSGCEQVLTSQYASLAGIPVALFGTIYYLVIFLLAIAYFDIKKNYLLILIPPLTSLGFLASVWFVYVQIFFIKAICLYCLGSIISSTLLFILGVILFFRLKTPPEQQKQQIE